MKLVIVAVVAAALGAGVTYGVMRSHSATSPASQATVPVVITTQDLVAGHRFVLNNLRVVQMPEDLVTPNAATSIDELAGHKTSFVIYQNQQVPLADVS